MPVLLTGCSGIVLGLICSHGRFNLVAVLFWESSPFL